MTGLEMLAGAVMLNFLFKEDNEKPAVPKASRPCQVIAIPFSVQGYEQKLGLWDSIKYACLKNQPEAKIAVASLRDIGRLSAVGRDANGVLFSARP